jgi:hypothetical protein
VLDVEPVELGGSSSKRGGGGKGAGAGVGGGQEQQQEEGGGGRKFMLAEVEVVKTADFGVNDVTYRCLTHLGALLQPGDSVMGCVPPSPFTLSLSPSLSLSMPI